MTKTFNSDSIIPYKEGSLIVDKEVKTDLEKQGKCLIYQSLKDDIVKQKFGNNALYTLDNKFKNISTALIGYWVIIASINIRIEGVPLIELSDEVEELAHLTMMNYLTKGNPKGDFKCSTIGADDNKNWWIAGYKANPKQFTEEDIRKAVDLGLTISTVSSEPFTSKSFKTIKNSFIESFLKSLQTKQISSVELEYEDFCDYEGEELWEITPDWRLKVHNPETNTIIPVKIDYNEKYSYNE